MIKGLTVKEDNMDVRGFTSNWQHYLEWHLVIATAAGLYPSMMLWRKCLRKSWSEGEITQFVQKNWSEWCTLQLQTPFLDLIML